MPRLFDERGQGLCAAGALTQRTDKMPRLFRLGQAGDHLRKQRGETCVTLQLVQELQHGLMGTERPCQGRIIVGGDGFDRVIAEHAAQEVACHGAGGHAFQKSAQPLARFWVPSAGRSWPGAPARVFS